VGEAIRWALLPDANNMSFADSPQYSQLSANIGAAAAYAMHFAYSEVW
jgi:hypothetical protein